MLSHLLLSPIVWLSGAHRLPTVSPPPFFLQKRLEESVVAQAAKAEADAKRAAADEKRDQMLNMMAQSVMLMATAFAAKYPTSEAVVQQPSSQ